MKRSIVQQLLMQVGAPKSAVSAALMNASDGTEVIRVFYDPRRVAPSIFPKVFEGYKVEVAQRKTSIGYPNLACH